MNLDSIPKKAVSGFVKITGIDRESKQESVLVDQPNLILKNGARIITYCLGNKPNSSIWGMYIGYNNSGGTFAPPTIDVDYAVPFQSTGNFGYIREPLTFDPTYQSEATYTDNIVLFSTMVTSANNAIGSQPLTDGLSRIFEVGLISVPDPTNPLKDLVFSRTQFNNIVYNANYNLNIVWGIKLDL